MFSYRDAHGTRTQRVREGASLYRHLSEHTIINRLDVLQMAVELINGSRTTRQRGCGSSIQASEDKGEGRERRGNAMWGLVGPMTDS